MKSNKNKIIYLQMIKLENIAMNDANVLLCHMNVPFFHVDVKFYMDVPFFYVDIEFYMTDGYRLYHHL